MVESISRLDLRYRFGLIAAGDFSPPAGSRYHWAGAAGKSLSPRVREARSLVNSCRLMKLQWQSLYTTLPNPTGEGSGHAGRNCWHDWLLAEFV